MMEQDSLKVTSHGSYSFHFAQFSRCTIFKSSQILSSFSSATLLFLHLLSPHSLMTLSLSALWLLVDTQHSCRFSLLSSLFPSFFTPFIISFSPLLAHLIFCLAPYCPLHICFHPFLPHIHYLEFASYFQLNIFVPPNNNISSSSLSLCFSSSHLYIDQSFASTKTSIFCKQGRWKCKRTPSERHACALI